MKNGRLKMESRLQKALGYCEDFSSIQMVTKVSISIRGRFLRKSLFLIIEPWQESSLESLTQLVAEISSATPFFQFEINISFRLAR